MRQRLLTIFHPMIILASTGVGILVATILYFVPIDLAIKIGIYTILLFVFNFIAIAWNDQRQFKRAARATRTQRDLNLPIVGGHITA